MANTRRRGAAARAHPPGRAEVPGRDKALKVEELTGAGLRYQDSFGEASGAGAPIVFLHAGSGSSAMWENQIPAFTGVGYRFIAYDRRAEGSAVDDLEALAAHLLLDRFHLVGTAAGGIVAVDYALSLPQRLRSLVVANSIVGVQDEEYLEMSRRLRPSPEFAAIPAEIRELGPTIARSTPKARGAGKSSPSTSRRKPTHNRITYGRAGAPSRSRPCSSPATPTSIPRPRCCACSPRAFRTANRAVIPECGHSAFWEQPDAFNRAVLDFISKH